jgi:hypothetical protein
VDSESLAYCMASEWLKEEAFEDTLRGEMERRIEAGSAWEGKAVRGADTASAWVLTATRG